MVRCSKEHLEEEKARKIKLQLCKALGEVRGKERHDFLESLLGREEYLSLAKRLMALILLMQDNTVSEVARTLKMSRATVKHLKTSLKVDQYAFIKNMYTEVEFSLDSVAKGVETVLRLGGPLPMAGDSLHDVVQGKHLDYKEKYKESEEKRRIFKKSREDDLQITDLQPSEVRQNDN